MNMNSLLVFAKAAEVNSFSEAGRRLKMPVSTVSRHIAELEENLGVRLLERTTRRIRVTDIGLEVLEHAQRTAELSDLVKSVVVQHTTGVAGLIRISSPSSISDRIVTPLVRQFQCQYPDVRIEISNENGPMDLINDSVDLVFRLGTLKDSCLVGRRIMTLSERLVASPAYLDRHGLPTAPAELCEHRVFSSLREPNDNIWRFVHENGRDVEAVSLKPHLATNNLSGMAEALLDGDAIGNLPVMVRPELVDGGQLIEVMPQWRLVPVALFVIHLSSRLVPRALRLFTEFAAVMAPQLYPHTSTGASSDQLKLSVCAG